MQALEEYDPALQYSVGLFGSGSEVLGFDTEMSRDHDWGSRLLLVLDAEAKLAPGERLQEWFALRLPAEFMGHPTNFGAPIFSGSDHRTELLEPVELGAATGEAHSNWERKTPGKGRTEDTPALDRPRAAGNRHRKEARGAHLATGVLELAPTCSWSGTRSSAWPRSKSAVMTTAPVGNLTQSDAAMGPARARGVAP